MNANAPACSRAYSEGFLHDLRTPLTVIRLHTQLAHRGVARTTLPDRARLLAHLDGIETQLAVLIRRLDQEQRLD